MKLNLKRKKIREYYNYYSADLSVEEQRILSEIGLKRIQNDRRTLINYAVERILEDYILKKELELSRLAKQRRKHGNKNKC